MGKRSRKVKLQRTLFGEMWRPQHPQRISVPHEVLDGSRTVVVGRDQITAVFEAWKRELDSGGSWPEDHDLPFPKTLFEFPGAVSFLPSHGEKLRKIDSVEGILIQEQLDGEEVIGSMSWCSTYVGTRPKQTPRIITVFDTKTNLMKVKPGDSWEDPTKQEELKIPYGIHLVALASVNSVLYMLDSANVDLVEASVQHERGHVGHGKIRYEILVQPSKSRYKRRDDTQPANYSHRFEVRGNFAHHYETKPDGTENKLFTKWSMERPEKIIEHAGRPCIRIWRPPYVKGPSDKPLVPKVRRIA